MKTKGQVEEAIKGLDLNQMTIFKPGVLTQRDNDFRCGEWFIGKIPFIPKMNAEGLGLVMLKHAIEMRRNNYDKKIIFLETRRSMEC